MRAGPARQSPSSTLITFQEYVRSARGRISAMHEKGKKKANYRLTSRTARQLIGNIGPALPALWCETRRSSSENGPRRRNKRRSALCKTVILLGLLSVLVGAEGFEPSTSW